MNDLTLKLSTLIFLQLPQSPSPPPSQYNDCNQQISFFDSSNKPWSPVVDGRGHTQLGGDSFWDRLALSFTFLKRDRSPTMRQRECLLYVNDIGRDGKGGVSQVLDDTVQSVAIVKEPETEALKEKVLSQKNGGGDRNKPNSDEMNKKGYSEDGLMKRGLEREDKLTFSQERSVVQNSGDADLLGKRDVHEDGQASEGLGKKKIIIDFQKAERDARLAGLAPGFIIETEYLTQQRKTVQPLPKPGVRTVKLHFEGEKLVLDDPQEASGNSVNATPSTVVDSIMNGVLSAHDQQHLDSFDSNFTPSITRPLSVPSYPQRDLA